MHGFDQLMKRSERIKPNFSAKQIRRDKNQVEYLKTYFLDLAHELEEAKFNNDPEQANDSLCPSLIMTLQAWGQGEKDCPLPNCKGRNESASTRERGCPSCAYTGELLGVVSKRSLKDQSEYLLERITTSLSWIKFENKTNKRIIKHIDSILGDIEEISIWLQKYENENRLIF